MAIEPLGNIMSVQAQPVQRVTVERPVENSTEASQQSVEQVVDAKTPAVVKAKETDGQQDNKQDQNAQAQAQQQQPSEEQLKKVIEQINKKANNSEVQFGIHEKTNRITIKIIDKETKETIKELPPEKTLDMIAKAWELAGIMVDERR